MKIEKIVEKLKREYPQKAIFKNFLDNGDVGEVLCEVDPASSHSDWSLAIAIIDQSNPHFHTEVVEEYKVLSGKLYLYIDGIEIILNEGDKYTIESGIVHWAKGNETWVEVKSSPGWYYEDHITLDDVVFHEESRYKEKDYISTFHIGDPAKLPAIEQAQAVPILIQDEEVFVVLYEHVEGFFGLPGGGVEEGETVEEALKRELEEEINCKMIDYGYLGYQLVKRVGENKLGYFGRYWTRVELCEGEVKDPCKKAVKRILVPIDKAAEKLDWGRSGYLWVEEAKKKIVN